VNKVLTLRGLRQLAAWLALACTVIVSGCATGAHPPAPARARPAPADADAYQIGAGDILNVLVWRNTDLSGVYPVRPDGKLSVPLVEDLDVQGKTPKQVAREIEKTLSNYIRDPVVTVIVTGFGGPFGQQVRVVGEAAKPQFLPYRKSMTLLDVMIAVGGLTDFADGNAATIMRSAEGNKQYSVRLRDLLKRGDLSANVEMQPGDVLVIPQSWF
jgi:polysaccharide export outer membrane protein